MSLSEVAFTGGCLLRTRRCVPEQLSLVNSEIMGVHFKKQNKDLCFVCVCMCVCVCVYVHGMCMCVCVCVNRLENNLSSCSSIAVHLVS